MNLSRLLIAGLSLLLGQTSAPPKDSGFTLSLDVDLVVFNVNVSNAKGRLVAGLSKDNFRIIEDGREEQIRFVQPEETPATIGLVIDNSGSMREKRADVSTAAIEFVESINPQDEIFIVNFNETVSMGLPDSVPFSHDLEQLRSALLGIRAAGKTALYDAIVAGLVHLQQGTHQRKALVVLSDGGDNVSEHTLKDTLAAAQQSNAALYTIGIYDSGDKDKNPKALRKIAQLTGGEVYLPERLDELPGIWRRIADGIRSQYTIGYVSSNPKRDGTFRSVKVVATDKDRKPLRVRSRKGYVAPASR
jgi:Ca-activated chloride channel family protein